MNNFLNQDKEVLKETLAGSNLDAVKTILRGLRNFKIVLPLLQALENSFAIPLSLCHIK